MRTLTMLILGTKIGRRMWNDEIYINALAVTACAQGT